jgi:hypothetical protein
MRIITLMFCIFFSLPTFAKEHFVTKRFDPKQSAEIQIPPNPDYVDLMLKVAEARGRCDEAPLVLKEEKGVIRERPVMLCAYDKMDDSWHVVSISIPLQIPKSYIDCMKTAGVPARQSQCHVPILVNTPGYCVEHVSGAGAARLGVILRRQDAGKCTTSIPVYAMEHLRIPGELPKSASAIAKVAERISYTPATNFASSPELVGEGVGFLRSQVKHALVALRNAQVYSRAFPGKLIADVIPEEIPMALALIEQWDPVRFRDIPSESFARLTLEYALNRESAFAWSVSVANAIGPLQFTDMKGNGTYSMIVRGYPEVHLVRDFELGTRDMGNVIKAAICLLDYELSRSQRAKKIFEVDPYLGGIQPVAAYNGGGGAGEKMLTAIEKLNKESLAELDPKAVKLPQSLSKGLERAVTKVAPGYHRKKRVKAMRASVRVNTETPNYVQKYLWVIDYLNKEEK